MSERRSRRTDSGQSSRWRISKRPCSDFRTEIKNQNERVEELHRQFPLFQDAEDRRKGKPRPKKTAFDMVPPDRREELVCWIVAKGDPEQARKLIWTDWYEVNVI